MNTTHRPFRVTNLTTGRKVSCATFDKAQVRVAAQIASDVEGQVVTIADTRTGEVTICRNNGLTIRYEAA